MKLQSSHLTPPVLKLDNALVTITVFYYRPDYPSLIQEFMWQTLDIRPTYPRIHKFLNYWKTDINAKIQEIFLCDSVLGRHAKFRNADEVFNLH